jgi:hypothetical protein
MKHFWWSAGLVGALCLSTGSEPAAALRAVSAARLFYLDISGGRVLAANPDGSDATVLVKGLSDAPDGIVVDVRGKHLFWTNMGRANADDGSIDRADLDGAHLTRVLAAGGAFTPKQLKLDATHGKLYWSDREGMRVMRSNLDGSRVETLVETGRGDLARRDAANWCVGIAVDVEGGKIYWTQKGGSNAGTGSIRRAGIEIPRGEDPGRRSDIEVLFDALPEPIDLDIDPGRRLMYWTDRGNPPLGNTVSRAPMDPPAGADPKARKDQQILVRDLREGIGIALDLEGQRMFITDLGGNVYSARLDGSDTRTLLTGQGSLTGIAYVQLPAGSSTAARRQR